MGHRLKRFGKGAMPGSAARPFTDSDFVKDPVTQQLYLKPELLAWWGPACGYVYFLRGPSGLVKIGRSKAPANRAKTFNVKLPFETYYLHVIWDPDAPGLETFLHRVFRSKRRDGEWFEISDQEIDEIKSGAFVETVLLNTDVEWEASRTYKRWIGV